MLDILVVGGAIIIGLSFIARTIMLWKKLDELDKEEDQEKEDHK